MQNKKGFTLIELLVVIAVIGLLASIVLVAVNNVRVKARDVKTKSDVNQIILAMEMYYDVYDEYPPSDNVWRCLKSSGTCWKGGYSGDADIVNALAPYLASIPKTQAKSGCYFYDTYLYHATHDPIGTYPAGAYIIWPKQAGDFETGECPGEDYGPYDCNEYHCYQFIGTN